MGTIKLNNAQAKNLVGMKFSYNGRDDIFKVREVRKFVIIFDCGHWVTDCVFCSDMHPITPIQLSLF